MYHSTHPAAESFVPCLLALSHYCAEGRDVGWEGRGAPFQDKDERLWYVLMGHKIPKSKALLVLVMPDWRVDVVLRSSRTAGV